MRLGLDLGTNSVGWTLFELGSNSEPVGIIKSGARIFPSGRDPKGNASLNEDRRAARSARRRRDRHLQRQKHLMQALIKHGLMPKKEAERKTLQKLNPYQLRAMAIDKEIPPYHVGRALFHLNQRRGFKSNRKNKDKDSKIVGESIKQFREQLKEKNAKTLGAYLWTLSKEEKPVRARRFGTAQKDLYELYPSRDMLEDEFECIWKKQSEFQSFVFTDAAKNEIKKIIFKQRPLKPPAVGKCTLIPEEERAPDASPIFQAFRIWQNLNNLKLHVGFEELYYFKDLEEELRKSLLKKLFSQKSMKFDALRKLLKKSGIEGDIRFNLETKKRKALEGDAVGAEFKKDALCGDQWFKWPLEKQNAFVACLLNHEADDEICIKKLVEDFDLEEKNARECIEISLPDGHAKLSEKAMAELLPWMEEGKDFYTAAEHAGFSVHHPEQGGESDRLPKYTEVISHYAVARKPAEEEEKGQDYRIPNPTVHIALNQLRKVVNDIIRIYGKPNQIHLELTRWLPLGNKAKKELEDIQKENQDINEEIVDLLKQHGQTIGRENIERVRMWKELSENVNHRCCVYTGEPIGIEKLFSPDVEIEHILPFSRTLDDSRANKTLSYRRANRYKGNKSPDEAFNNEQARQDGYDWKGIFQRAGDLPPNKHKRFYPKAIDDFLRDKDFLDRQLTDTSYIGKAAREYLTTICPKDSIVVIPGRLTAWLRKAWGLNEVLGKKGEKNRDDHRHHAVDATVVGVTSRSTLQKIATAVRKDEGKFESEWLKSKYVKEPWKDFRDDVKESVQKIIVSHKSDRKASGQLHNDTAYGIVGDYNPNGTSKVIHHIPLTDIKSFEYIERVRNPVLREKLQDFFAGEGAVLQGAEFKNALARFGRSKNIRRVCIEENLKVVPIYKDGKPYKYFKTDGNWGYEIFSSEGKWGGEIISLFDANRKDFKPRWQQENPDAFLIMRIHGNDMLKLKIDGQEKIVRVQTITKGQVSLVEHNEANVDKRNRDQKDSFNYTHKSPSALQKSDARKIHISPSGLVYDPGPYKMPE